MKLLITIKRYIYWDLIYPLKKNFLNIPKSLFIFNYGLFNWFLLSRKNKIKLDLGTGAKGKNGFTTIALDGADICWDLRRGIPLDDKSVEYIYSSHLLEHIPFRELIIFLKECKRVLKDEGVFSVCVPNFRLYIEAYSNNRNFKVENYYKWAIADTGSKIDQLNYMAYMNEEHKYLFDEENLLNILLKTGFKKVKLRSFDPKLDAKRRDFESIYAIAIKS